MLLATGLALGISAVLEVRERARLSTVLAVIGAPSAALRRCVLIEACVRQAVMLGCAASSGLIVAWAATGWTSADAVPPGWVLSFGFALVALAVGAVVATVVAQVAVSTGARSTGGFLVDR